jgi:oxidase EvaA
VVKGLYHDFHDWWSDRCRANQFEVTEVPFSQLDRWRFAPETGNLAHDSGRFFAIEGLYVKPDQAVSWYQPILSQPEIGILGLLVREIDGVPHALMQAKMEPGNVNDLQLSPTVQATRSNYTTVHQGHGTRYLDWFHPPDRSRILVDALQSEQGMWFWRKRNRNLVVKATKDVPSHEDHRWVPVHQVFQLLRVDNLVNMETRSVISSLPASALPAADRPASDSFAEALHRSYQAHARSRHAMHEVLSWLTESRTRCDWAAMPVPLAGLHGWSQTDGEISDGERFRIVAVRVRAANREVSRWAQPLLAPYGQGVATFLVREIDGVLHVLVRARPEPGLLEMVEIGPTVRLPAPSWSAAGVAEPYADAVAGRDPARVRFDTVLSEEGGRFYHAQCRYQVIDVGDEVPIEVPDDFIWVTVHQLMRLVRHGRYLNVESRTLLACLHALR